MATERSNPPTWTLLLAAALAMVTVAVIGTTFSDDSKDLLAHYNLERLSKTHKPVVAVIGTSLIRHALPFDDELLPQTESASVRVVRLTRSSGTPNDFSPLLPYLLRSGVQTVIFQAEPFAIEFGGCNVGPAVYCKLVAAIDQPIMRFRRFVYAKRQGLGTSNDENFGDSSLILDRVENDPDVDLKTRVSVTTAVMPPPFVEFLLQAKKLGIRIVLLSMGRAPQATASLGEDFQSRYGKALMFMGAHYGLEVWRFPQQADRYYKDRAHLNSLGRKVFTQWFLAQLSELNRGAP